MDVVDKGAVAVRAKDFMGRNGFISISFILFDWALIVATVALSHYIAYIAHPLLFAVTYVAAVWFIGSRMVALAEVFGHDSVHYSLFARRSLNYKLDFLWFLPLFESWKSYRDDHAFHHSHLLTPKDPAYRDFERWGLLKPKMNYTWVWFIRPFLLFDTPYMLKTIALSLVKDYNYRNRILAFWLPTLALFWYLGALDLLALYWFVPLLWAYPALIFWSETGEHYRVPNDVTRNTFGLLEWLFVSPHNDRFHYIHHRYPNIPWFRLKRATEALLPESAPASRSFIDLFHQVSNERDQRIAEGQFLKGKAVAKKGSRDKSPASQKASSP